MPLATSKLLLSALAVSSLVSGTFAGKSKSKKKAGKCPKKTTPPSVMGMGKCPEGTSLVEFLDCVNGGLGGFDDNSKNLNIVTDLILHVGLDPSGLEEHLFMLPYDEGVMRTVNAIIDLLDLGDELETEEETADFIKAVFPMVDITNILLYHVSDTPYTYKMLLKEKEIDTLLDESILVSQEANPTPNCDKRVRLRDEFREEVKLREGAGHAKIHNRWRDIELEDGNILQIVKALMLPGFVAE